MTKMLDPIEEARRPLLEEIATLREVNDEQAKRLAGCHRIMMELTAENDEFREQIRKAQERIRVAEAFRNPVIDDRWKEQSERADKAEAERDHLIASLKHAHGKIERLEAERDRAWNEAIEAAAAVVKRHGAECKEGISALGDTPAIKASASAANGACVVAAGFIRSLAKEAGE
jgi:chromosome segregation ATPase